MRFDHRGHRHHHPHHHPGPGPGPVPPVPPGFGPGGPGVGPVPGPWGAGPWVRRGFGGGGRGRGRAGRGDVRAAVLLLLSDGPKHGYQLMQAIAERTGGVWKPSPGAVYPTISQLEDEGLVSVTADGGRKLVALTESGQKYVTENKPALGDPFAGFAARTGGDAGADLLTATHELQGAVWQVARAGDAGQITAASRILTDARRALYLLLAGEAPEAAPAPEAAQAAPEANPSAE